MSVNVHQIVVFGKFKHSDEGFKYFIGYQEDETVKHYALFYLKWVDTSNTLKTMVKTCLFLLEMIMCWINTMKFGVWLKKVKN